MAHKYILGVFDDDHVILEAAKTIRAEHIRINDVLSPFPIHGIDPVLGLKESRLHIVGFIFGLLGLSLMLTFISWIGTTDYPTIYGGKNFWALPAYVPVLFEITVLFASISMVVAFFLRNGLSAIRPQPIIDERITNDKFVMQFNIDNRDSAEIKKIQDLLKKTGASEINEKEL